MKNMKIGKNKPRHYTPFCALWTHDQKQREKALELSKKHIDVKPIKYLLK